MFRLYTFDEINFATPKALKSKKFFRGLKNNKPFFKKQNLFY